MLTCSRPAPGGEHPHEDPNCVAVNADTLPYLSVGINRNKPGEQSVGLGRVSSWPQTAAQWQQRCKQTEKWEEEASDVLTVCMRFPEEVKEVWSNVDPPSECHGGNGEDTLVNFNF